MLLSTEERRRLSRQWNDIRGQLKDLANCKVQPGEMVDFTAREAEIIKELNRITYILAADFDARYKHKAQPKDQDKG